MSSNYLIGEFCSFAKGASVPRDRMFGTGSRKYLHYGDLYKGHELYIDIEKPTKPIPFISEEERIKSNQFVSDGDIIYVLTSETVDDLGKALMVKGGEGEEIVAGTETTVMRVENREIADPAYINYMLQTELFKRKLRQYVTGMKVFRVHPRDIAKIEVSLPDIETQNKVVCVLDAIYEKRSTVTHLNDYLAELLDALFAKALEGTDDWEEATLLDIASYKNGLAMQKFRPEGDDPGLPVLKIKELGQGSCGPDAERCRSDIDESVRINDGDLVFSWSGTLLLDFWAGGDAGLNQHLFKVTSGEYPSWFVYMWTKYHMRRFIALAKDRATTMGHIKRSALAEAEVLIPSADVLNKLTEQMQPVVDQIIGLKVEARKLSELRDALLPKLMSGEIDASKVDLAQSN